MQKRLINRRTFPTKYVLLVEDNFAQVSRILGELAQVFDPEGDIEFVVVPGGAYAVPFLFTGGKLPVCILLDHDLPWGSGSDLLAAMNTEKLTVPVGGISGIPANNTHMATFGAHVTPLGKTNTVGIIEFIKNACLSFPMSPTANT